jgi:hypothetical protein
VVGKKCNPNRKLAEMSRTGNLLLLISSLILRCFSIKEKISGSGRTELSIFVVWVAHFTDLEIKKLHFSTF